MKTHYNSQLPKLKYYKDDRGCLSVLDNIAQLPFSVKRLYLLDSADGQIRGNHGHYACDQYLSVLSGLIEYQENSGQVNDYVITLSEGEGYLIRKGYWHRFRSIGQSRCLVIASHEYDPKDYFYIRPKL